jgi:phosphatidylglycerol:prolipoprotein diacylglycerol transferase
VGIAIARLGCFANGCCFGGRCHLPWGVHLPAASGVSSGAATPALHPLPLYFAATAAGLTLLLLWKGRRKQYDGQLVLWLLFASSLSGALLEPLRHDPSRVSWGPLPQLLWVNAAMSAAALGGLVAAALANRRRARASPGRAAVCRFLPSPSSGAAQSCTPAASQATRVSWRAAAARRLPR